MKRVDTNFSWLVTIFNCNKQKIEKYDVLRYREEDIKKLKKKYPIKEEFEKEFKIRCQSRFWSRAGYEFILEIGDEHVWLKPWCGFLEIGDKHVWLKPWCGCRDSDYKIDVTDETDFDWKGFAEKHINTKYGPEAKIDVWDQLEYRWDEFVDYVWNYHHKWQRKKK